MKLFVFLMLMSTGVVYARDFYEYNTETIIVERPMYQEQQVYISRPLYRQQVPVYESTPIYISPPTINIQLPPVYIRW